MKQLDKRLRRTRRHVRHASIGLGVFAVALGFTRLIGWRLGSELSWIGAVFFAVVAAIEGGRWLLLTHRKRRKLLRATESPAHAGRERPP